jgi:quinol monooxygenase YgiN
MLCLGVLDVPTEVQIYFGSMVGSRWVAIMQAYAERSRAASSVPTRADACDVTRRRSISSWLADTGTGPEEPSLSTAREDKMTRTTVATIDASRPVLTLINVYDVEPTKQAELTELLSDVTEKVMRHLPGFVSVSIHRSVDGTRVANYAQWASKEDFERMMKNPDAQARIKQLAAVAKSVSPAIYQVSSVHPG